MQKEIILLIAVILLTLIVVIALNPHIINLLRYGKSDIDDYKKFPNDTIETLFHIPLKISKNYNKFELSEKSKIHIKKYKTVAFLIIQNNEIKYEKYWYGYDTSTLINSFSAAKGIVSILTGIAIDKGYIKSINQEVEDFYPQFKSTGLTIKDLLSMSSGLNWEEDFFNPFKDLAKAYYGKNIDKLVLSKTVNKDEKSKIWRYKCGNTLLLSLIIQKSSGLKISKFASEYLWKKLGSEHKALWTTDTKNGTVKAFCCFNATARDFARLGIMMLNYGIFNRVRIISEDYVRQAFTPVDHLVNKRNEKVDYYGYHFWITRYKGHTIPYFRGMYGQYIFMIPQKDAVVVRLGKRRTEDMTNHTPNDVFGYLDAAFEILD